MKLLTDEEIKDAAMDAARYLDWELPNPPTEYTFTSDGVKTFARAIEAAIIKKLGEPVGYISNESIYRLKHGGNSKGAVPIHRIKSVASNTPLFKLPEVKE